MAKRHILAGRSGRGAVKSRAGEAHGMARLTERRVETLRRAAWTWLDRHPDEDTLPADFFRRQGARYDVASATARAAIHGDTWGHLADPAPVPRPHEWEPAGGTKASTKR